MELLRRALAALVALTPFLPMIQFYDGPGLFGPASRISFATAMFGTSGDGPRAMVLFLAVVPLGAVGALVARGRLSRAFATAAIALAAVELGFVLLPHLSYGSLLYRIAHLFFGSGVPRDWFLAHALVAGGAAAGWRLCERAPA